MALSSTILATCEAAAALGLRILAAFLEHLAEHFLCSLLHFLVDPFLIEVLSCLVELVLLSLGKLKHGEDNG